MAEAEKTPRQAFKEITQGKEVIRNVGFLFISLINFILGRKPPTKGRSSSG